MASKLSLRNLFQSSPSPASNTSPKGASGRAHFNGLIELDELNLDLAGQRGRLKFDEMYWSDTDVRRLVLMCWSPIQAGVLNVEPYGGDEASPKDKEAADLVKWALWEAMCPALPSHLVEAGPMLLRQGFCPFEQIWMAVEWKGKLVQVPRKLDMRLPRTIWKWYQDGYGNLTEMVQILPNAKMAVIPASALTYYRIQAEGDNWEGRSLLRPAYKNWKLKDSLERIDAIGQEHKACGVPVAYPPVDADTQQKEELENVLAGMHTSEVSYLISPWPHVSAYNDSEGQGALIDVIKYDSSSGTGIQDSIKIHKEAIAGSILGDFMQLGHHQVGARATAEVQEDPFLTAVRGFAQIPLEELNRSVVQRIVNLNCPDVEGFPELKLTIEDEASLAELSTYVQQCIQAGAMVPDPELEDFLRDRANLPPANPAVRAQHEAAQQAAREYAIEGGPPAAPGYQGKPAPGMGNLDSGLQTDQRQKARKPEQEQHQDAPDEVARGRSRKPVAGAYARTFAKGDPAWYEQLLSQGQIKQALDDARDRFQQAGAAPLKDFTAQAVQRAKTGRPAPDAPPQALVDALTGELDALYQTGVQTVHRELSHQHARLGTGRIVTLDAGTAIDAGSSIYTARRRQVKKAGQVAARNVVREVSARIENAAVNPNASEATLLAVGTAAAESALRSQAQQTATLALNGGRSDAAESNMGEGGIAGAFYTSCLDPNTCDECQVADNGELIQVGSPEYEALSPPNPDCAGGPRCRCMWVYVLSGDPAALG